LKGFACPIDFRANLAFKDEVSLDSELMTFFTGHGHLSELNRTAAQGGVSSKSMLMLILWVGIFLDMSSGGFHG